MRIRFATSVLLVACVLAVAALPAAAAPKQQLGGWTSTEYILIDGTDPQQPPRVVYSTIYGVQVTRPAGSDRAYDVTFVRNYRFLVASAYGLCFHPNWDCAAQVTVDNIMRNQSDPRRVRIALNKPGMISIILKP